MRQKSRIGAVGLIVLGALVGLAHHDATAQVRTAGHEDMPAGPASNAALRCGEASCAVSVWPYGAVAGSGEGTAAKSHTAPRRVRIIPL
jgi:hypothetical protein